MCLSLMIDSAKIRKISDAAKFRAPNWPDLQHQFGRFLQDYVSRPDCRNFRADEP